MVSKPMHTRLLAITLSLLTIFITAPFSIAETAKTLPLGTVTVGSVTVGNTSAPSGTTIFSGDNLISKEIAILALNSGSGIEMTQAEAAFTRQGETLIVGADRGLFRFNFKKGEKVQIDAGKFLITGVDDTDLKGELGLNSDGEVAVNLIEGEFVALNTETGERTQIALNRPMVVFSEDNTSAAGTKAANGLNTAEKVLMIAGVGGTATAFAVAIRELTKSRSSR